MYVGLLDRACPYIEARHTQKIIGESVTAFVTAPLYTHGDWGSPLEPWLYEKLIGHLTDPTAQENENITE